MTTLKEFEHHIETAVGVVTFLKANGKLREMQCTRASYLLPEVRQESNHTNNETVIVFDLEAEDWRSFRKDRVVTYEVV